MTSMMILGIHPGDEVISSSFRFLTIVAALVLDVAALASVDIESEGRKSKASLIEAAIALRTAPVRRWVSLHSQPT